MFESTCPVMYSSKCSLVCLENEFLGVRYTFIVVNCAWFLFCLVVKGCHADGKEMVEMEIVREKVHGWR